MSEKATQIIGTCLGMILIPVLIALGMSAAEKHDEKYPWRGSLYSVDQDGGKRIIEDNDELKTVEECRSWANERADRKDLEDGKWDYECGSGCTYEDDEIAGGKRIKNYGCTTVTK
jgi:hypothetical protein